MRTEEAASDFEKDRTGPSLPSSTSMSAPNSPSRPRRPARAELADVLDEDLGDLAGRGGDPRRSLPGRVAVQRELADDEDRGAELGG